ncbi:MAG: hypothetical protein ACI8P9_000206 [Parasphingorhabdus sp.]|jgi:uncharacterized protein YyaL (SSP411 family)
MRSAFLWIFLFFILPGVASAQNQLVNHPSPYLALHGQDPVNWLDWNASAVQEARKSNKLLFLSIGYFSCHWCHVMQKESYQDTEIAEVLNKNFVSVKIDRELEPALDARLIDFAEKTLGRAGWPLNVFVTPDGFPVFAVLYMPPSQFGQILDRLNDVWKNQREQITNLARQVNLVSYPDAGTSTSLKQSQLLVDQLVNQALEFHDDFQGGFGNQNKFPHAPELSDLLEVYAESRDERLGELLRSTLDAMNSQGLWDHIGGGFFRYVVDPDWHIPHFEKMLYDNALLGDVYLKAAQLFPDREYQQIAIQTLDFLITEMQSDEGAFISSFSAVDDAGLEGGYYLWSDQELEQLLEPDELRLLRTRCQVRGIATGEGHHLRCSDNIKQVAKNIDLDIDTAFLKLESAMQKVTTARERRTLPADTKLLAGWNGLALTLFSNAARELQSPMYKSVAQQIRDYLISRLWDGENLSRARVQDLELGTVSLEDYAYVAKGLWHFATLTNRAEDFEMVKLILTAGFEKFWNNNSWQLSSQTLLQAESGLDLITDSPLPAPSAMMGNLAIKMGDYTGDQSWFGRANQVLNRGHKKMTENAFFYSSHIMALRNISTSALARQKVSE